MKGDNYISLLGRTSDDPEVKTLLTESGITKPPKLKRGDLDAYAVNKKLGLEIIFRDERYLDVKSQEYEEGALVLWNVAMYCESENMESYPGELPIGLKCNLGRKEVVTKLGKKPAWEDKESGDARWDFPGYCLFITFDSQLKKIRNLGVQLPLA